MSKILFTWELGEGSGHIMPYIELISRLVAEGHEVHFALRSLHKAYEIFHGIGVIWHQAPLVLPRHIEAIMPINCYAKILHHAGYDNGNRLAGLIIAWQNLFNLINPDVIIFDFSPTAMLASRISRAKKIVIGTGFEIPPRITPVPYFDIDISENKNVDQLLAFENNVLGVINKALDLASMDPLDEFTSILDADEVILRTLHELDHYKGRIDAKYAGIMKSTGGQKPVWPSGAGPRIFAYLKYFETLPALLEALNRKMYPVLIYGDKIPQDIEQRYSSKTVNFVKRPLDMDMIGKSADLAISNAGHGTVTELLLSGVPQLLLPLNAEQCLVANNVERLGAGLSAPHLHPRGMEDKLDALVKDENFKASAKRFSESYFGTNVTNLTETVLGKINSLL